MRMRSSIAVVAIVAIAATACDGSKQIDRPPTAITRSEVVETTAPPALTTKAPVELTPAGGPGAASNLRAQPSCNEANRGVVAMRWDPATRGGSQRVDVTGFQNGFETGQYESTEELSQSRATWLWGRAPKGGFYLWRVLTRHGSRWTPSEIGRFPGPSCATTDEQG